MKTIQAPRASTILYNLLVSQKKNKPWLLPANICPIVPITFMKAGVAFEFVDVSEQTLHMDLNQAESRLKKGDIGGLLYAHTYGEESTPDDFFARAKSLRPEMLIVDDRCLCIPSFETESSSDVVLFSTGYAKIVELEFGGYAFLRDEVKYRPSQLPFHSSALHQLEEYYKSTIREGVKFEYQDSDWLMTAIDMPKWDDYRKESEGRLEVSLAHRQALNEIYASLLPREIQLPEEYQRWRFNIRVKNQADVMSRVFDNHFFASTHYASLAGIMTETGAPVAEKLAGEVVNLFNDHHFTPDMAERVCGIVVKYATR